MNRKKYFLLIFNLTMYIVYKIKVSNIFQVLMTQKIKKYYYNAGHVFFDICGFRLTKS